MAELARTATPLAMPDVARVGASTFAELFGRLVPPGMLALCCAIVGIENGRGRAIIQHNWGNLSGDGPAGYWVPPTTPAGQPARFQAFESHEAGARAWWRLVARRYRSVLLAGYDNDPRLAVRELYRLGYVAPSSPGEEGRYSAAVVQMFAEARQSWIPSSRVYPSPALALAPAVVSLVAGLALVARSWSSSPRSSSPRSNPRMTKAERARLAADNRRRSQESWDYAQQKEIERRAALNRAPPIPRFDQAGFQRHLSTAPPPDED